jgi:hypothetical protein
MLTLLKFVKQEDANKYRCKAPDCTKLFKGPDFWRKHVEKRHADWYALIVNDVELVNTYVVDPAHIAPSRSDANSNGHFPLNNHVPTGTPRGFQLSQQFPMGFPMAAGMPAAGLTSGGIWTPGGANGIAMSAGWAPPTAAGFSAGIGPMRNLGRNNFTGLTGGVGGMRTGMPYMRTDARGQRMGPGMPVGGAMGMGPGMPMGAMGPRQMAMAGFGTGMEGGASAMGPREAVAGRQLRSYEDLDADSGKGVELDY